MNTYSHLIVAAALQKPLQKLKKLPPLKTRSWLVGSVLPDLLLIAITTVTILHDRLVDSLPDFVDGEPVQNNSWTAQLFRTWFFENRWVITAQNLFHSPLLITLYIALGYWAWKRGYHWGNWFFWLALSTMLHTLADIPLHVDDGPLLLFPLDWQLRYKAPISYWDPNYYGGEWSRFEHLVDIVLLGYLAYENRILLKRYR